MDIEKSNTKIIDARLKHPFNMIVSGITQCGKTTFTIQLLEHADRLIDAKFDYIYWLYGEYTDKMEELKKKFGAAFNVFKGIPDDLETLIKPNLNGCMIIDDLMIEASNNKQITSLFTRKCSHNNISVILITQNLYYSGTERISILRNAHYLVIFHNPLDQSVVQYLAKKIFPQNPKIFHDIYEKTAAGKPHGYLFIDGKQTTVPELRFRTDIFDLYQKIYVPIQPVKS